MFLLLFGISFIAYFVNFILLFFTTLAILVFQYGTHFFSRTLWDLPLVSEQNRTGIICSVGLNPEWSNYSKVANMYLFLRSCIFYYDKLVFPDQMQIFCHLMSKNFCNLYLLSKMIFGIALYFLFYFDLVSRYFTFNINPVY